VPLDLPIAPSDLLAMWAGGMAVGAAAVARWKVVGAGYLWLAAGAALLAGGFAAFSNPWAAVSAAALLAGALLARRPAPASAAFALAGVGFLVGVLVSMSANPVLALTGALALGGTTCEMLLGHWYLVDPKLPRWALRRLDGAGIAGLILDTVGVIALGGLATDRGVLRWIFLGLALLSVLMMVGVWFSLREKGYEGVMAATGLSYLSVLTALGAVATGRFLLG
jgi:hypothetical protein